MLVLITFFLQLRREYEIIDDRTMDQRLMMETLTNTLQEHAYIRYRKIYPPAWNVPKIKIWCQSVNCFLTHTVCRKWRIVITNLNVPFCNRTVRSLYCQQWNKNGLNFYLILLGIVRYKGNVEFIVSQLMWKQKNFSDPNKLYVVASK